MYRFQRRTYDDGATSRFIEGEGGHPPELVEVLTDSFTVSLASSFWAGWYLYFSAVIVERDRAEAMRRSSCKSKPGQGSSGLTTPCQAQVQRPTPGD